MRILNLLRKIVPGNVQATSIEDVAVQIVDALNYPWGQFALEDFIKWLEQEFKVSLELITMPLPPTIFGALLRGPKTKTYYIIYDDNLAPFHQQHVVLHELGHWLCGHNLTMNADKILNSVQWRDYKTIPRAINENSQARQEAEAEAVAVLIQEYIARSAEINGSNKENPLHCLVRDMDG